jgi:pilus assembly protein FimV
VGKAITNGVIAAVLALTVPFAVNAAGLGRLTVLSPLGQPLNAEIEIVALKPGEEDSLSARLAPLEAFEAAGIEPGVVLNSVRFAIERRDGRRIVRVTTLQPVNEPFVELLVELQSQHGRLVREYTFLLDPAEYKARETYSATPTPKPMAPVQPAAPAQPAAPPPLVEPAKPASEAALPPLAAAPAPTPSVEPEKPAAAESEKPAAAVEEKPVAEGTKEPEKEEAEPLLADDASAYEVMKGDTLAKIAGDRLPPGITLNQMLVAIYRSNQDAFIRENLNLVRAGRILNIPGSDDIGTVNMEEANRVVRAHMAEFRDYRARLAAAPAVADAASGQREAAGTIEPKPEAPKPAAQDQVRLSKLEAQRPSAAASSAARGDDLAARERALKEAQSRIGDLEKNVADLQKLLELKNQQLAELEKRAAAKPAAAASAPAAPAAPAPAPAAQAPEKPAADPTPVPVAQAPAAQAPAAPQPAAAPAQPARPAPKKAAPPPPEPSLLDEFLDNPVALAGLGGVVILLLAYAILAWRKKKSAQARFQDSVIGAAAAGAAAGGGITEPSFRGSAFAGSPSAGAAASAATPGEEVDPIAEADVYMAYGRDAQAEEILKEALQKDANRIPVHAKLLEIYAKRRDTKGLEQSAAKLKALTNGAGPEWEKAAALGKSIDPTNGLYAGAAVTAAAVAAAEASTPSGSAPALDFDVGASTQASAPVPDFSLDVPSVKADTGIDFDISGVPTNKDKAAEDTVVPTTKAPDKDPVLDFDLDLGAAAPEAKREAVPATAPAADQGLSFDLNLELGGENKAQSVAAAPPAPDFSGISLDLGSSAGDAADGADPKWQEIATKLDLAKAYDEMGDKDGARELLNEVMKDGDSAQKGQAQQLLVKIG